MFFSYNHVQSIVVNGKTGIVDYDSDIRRFIISDPVTLDVDSVVADVQEETSTFIYLFKLNELLVSNLGSYKNEAMSKYIWHNWWDKYRKSNNINSIEIAKKFKEEGYHFKSINIS